MSRTQRTLDEIRRAGLEALDRELGPVAMIRFLQQFELGHGDYTADRDRSLGDMNVSDIRDAILNRRNRPRHE